LEISGIVAGGDLYRQMKLNVVHPKCVRSILRRFFCKTAFWSMCDVFGRCLLFQCVSGVYIDFSSICGELVTCIFIALCKDLHVLSYLYYNKIVFGVLVQFSWAKDNNSLEVQNTVICL